METVITDVFLLCFSHLRQCQKANSKYCTDRRYPIHDHDHAIPSVRSAIPSCWLRKTDQSVLHKWNAVQVRLNTGAWPWVEETEVRPFSECS